MKFYANLHTHSTHSDGVYSPEEMVRVAKEEGYGAIALADHDTATGFPALAAACEKEGMETVFGVEFTVFKPKPYHITAYRFDPEYAPMKQYLSDMAFRQTDNTKKCFDEAVALGNITGITWNEVLEYNEDVKWLCNNHVFEAMKAKGLVEQSGYYAWFVKNFRDQRAKFPPAKDFLSVPELISMVDKAGGFTLVAHPHNQLDDIEELIEIGIRGLEVWHPDMTPEEQKRAYDIAIQHRLFISGGSDHSGLCGGNYASFPPEEDLKKCRFYIEPQSVGTTEHFFHEIQEGKINR